MVARLLSLGVHHRQGKHPYASACNAPRPYEQGIDALLKKKRTGHSFPSRHVFSAVMIAVTAAYLLPALSVPLFVAAALLALIRVLGGIHYPRDVFCGALFALIAGGIGFWLIP